MVKLPDKRRICPPSVRSSCKNSAALAIAI
jgi:hypothetical protein